ncbi:MAG: MinD/ParA family protein [Candidatus Aenigmatarchaeota archaeon]
MEIGNLEFRSSNEDFKNNLENQNILENSSMLKKATNNKGYVISVISGKGGVGKTSISTSLAWVIAKKFGLKTLLIDANITSSHVSSFLRIPTIYTLNDILEENTIDFSRIQTYDNVLHVITSRIIGKSYYLDVESMKNIVDRLRESYDVIVLDSSPGIGNETLASIEASDTCLIVTTPYFPSVVDVIRIKEVLEQLREKRARIIVNMIEKKIYELSINEIKYATGLPIIGVIPFDENMIEASARGNLIARYRPGSRFAKSIEKIAYQIISERFGIDYEENIFKRILRFFYSR